MNESENYAGEFTDTDLNALADAGEFYLDESGFFLMPSQKEMQELAEMGWPNLESGCAVVLGTSCGYRLPVPRASGYFPVLP